MLNDTIWPELSYRAYPFNDHILYVGRNQHGNVESGAFYDVKSANWSQVDKYELGYMGYCNKSHTIEVNAII